MEFMGQPLMEICGPAKGEDDDDDKLLRFEEDFCIYKFKFKYCFLAAAAAIAPSIYISRVYLCIYEMAEGRMCCCLIY